MTAPTTDHWLDTRFQEDASAWIERQLSLSGRQTTGPIEQIHVRPWSTVMRVPTDHGLVFFKASQDSLRHEAAIVRFLGNLRPDFVPVPIAVDVERGWLLMVDAGESLRDIVERERSMDPWLQLLPLYADLQLDTITRTADLIALGVPHLSLAALPARFAALLDSLDGLDDAQLDVVNRARDHGQAIESMADALGAFGIPETLQHDDLNDGQVYFLDGRPLLLDWADACISHPFFSLSVALEGVISWGVDDVEDSVDTDPFRDVYLARFADRLGADLADLRRASEIAIRLGWACRVVNGHVIGDNEPTIRRLQMLMDGRI